MDFSSFESVGGCLLVIVHSAYCIYEIGQFSSHVIFRHFFLFKLWPWSRTDLSLKMKRLRFEIRGSIIVNLNLAIWNLFRWPLKKYDGYFGIVFFPYPYFTSERSDSEKAEVIDCCFVHLTKTVCETGLWKSFSFYKMPWIMSLVNLNVPKLLILLIWFF